MLAVDSIDRLPYMAPLASETLRRVVSRLQLGEAPHAIGQILELRSGGEPPLLLTIEVHPSFYPAIG